MVLSTQIGSAIGRGDVNLLVLKGSDFRPLFGYGSVERGGIYLWERAVKCGTTAAILAVRLNASYTLGEALEAMPPTLPRHVRRHRRRGHMCAASWPHAWSLCASAQGTLHIWWAVHVAGKADTNVVIDGVTYLTPYVAPWGERGGPKHALWCGLALLFEPFAAQLFKTQVPSQRQRVPCAEGCIGNSGCFSYIGASVHAGGEQLYLHLDTGNIDYTIVLVFGAPMQGWPELFPTVGCVAPCGVWSYSVTDAECLLHGVGFGSGFRIVLVFCSHRAIVEGVDRNGKRVRWELKKQSGAKL